MQEITLLIGSFAFLPMGLWITIIGIRDGIIKRKIARNNLGAFYTGKGALYQGISFVVLGIILSALSVFIIIDIIVL